MDREGLLPKEIKKSLSSNTQFMLNNMEIANWYVENIDTYCNVVNGTSTARGRRFYLCDLDGKLSDVKVGDDCSSYLWACLVQSGHFDNSVEYAYSWGKVYTEEPARKSANTGNINTKYTGIWRLESE